MTEKFRAWLAKKGAKPPVNLLLALGLGGMLLILLADLRGASSSQTAAAAPVPDTAAQAALTEAEYTAQLEQKLQQMICQIEGAGETAVMITLEGSRETIYAQSEKNGGEGGSRESSPVLRKASSGEEALVEMTWEPEIRGVAVVCQGGADITVAARVTELVSVVLGVPSHRISIAKMS